MLLSKLYDWLGAWRRYARKLYVLLITPGETPVTYAHADPDSKVHGANMGPIWGRQDPGGPHVGHMNFAIRA